MDFEGPPSKLKRLEDQDDGFTPGRSGRVRKKSAKVLEMEEFEQVEKTQHVTKKGKTPKVGIKTPGHMEESDSPQVEKLVPKKAKTPKVSSQGSALAAALDVTPVSSKSVKATVVKSEIGAQLAKQIDPVQAGGLLITGLETNPTVPPTDFLAAAMKQELDTDLSTLADLGIQQQLLQQSSPVKSEDQKSVIKYLLSSPSSGTKPSVSTNAVTKVATPISGTLDTLDPVGKKSVKKPKQQDKSVTKTKPKEKKQKTEQAAMDASHSAASGLKMKIFASSDPATAQVTLSPQTESAVVAPAKPKKSAKKVKQDIDIEHDVMLDSEDILSLEHLAAEELVSSPVKKPPKKASKKKEKLIQDAISAAQKLPNLAALVASQALPPGHSGGQGTLSTPGQKPVKTGKKKMKTTAPASAAVEPDEHSVKPEIQFGDDGEEAHLVIAETEKKKKKSITKKKGLIAKEKAGSSSPKGDKPEKKLSKRAPTAYMLFCNTHRPTIVNENPGIEFAGISRKLGELWQTLSNKQKLQWRRKAQRRKKKGSNLISTGKAGKEPSVVAPTPSSSAQSPLGQALKIATLKSQRSIPEDTSVAKNFSIEPIDVAAHLKLLGESLSIIGMRLQEHKGMIAVQGSLSVLLDSLLCACGPLLCLTQQVPGMDGCSPLVHGQTLDSVAYVMPGL